MFPTSRHWTSELDEFITGFTSHFCKILCMSSFQAASSLRDFGQLPKLFYLHCLPHHSQSVIQHSFILGRMMQTT